MAVASPYITGMGATSTKLVNAIKLPAGPSPGGGAVPHGAPLARLAHAVAAIPSNGRGANSVHLFLP